MKACGCLVAKLQLEFCVRWLAHEQGGVDGHENGEVAGAGCLFCVDYLGMHFCLFG